MKDPSVLEDNYDIPMDVNIGDPIEEDGKEDEGNVGDAKEKIEGHAGGEADSVGVRAIHTISQVGLILTMGIVLIKLPFKLLFSWGGIPKISKLSLVSPQINDIIQ